MAKKKSVAKVLEDMNGLKEDPDALWTPAAAAAFLGVTPSALQRWRAVGGGPTYVRISANRVLYRKQALIDFYKGREFQSTSEEAAAKSGGTGGPS